MSSGGAERLVIGYGNELRGDDAAGPLLARRVAERKLPGVVAVAVPQLLPELVELMRVADEVFFIDAGLISTANPGCEFHVQPLTAGAAAPPMDHMSDPRSLLALTAALHGRCPSAWLVTIAAESFAFGAALSARTRAGMEGALGWILAQLERPKECTPLRC
jgi:hydrogenase maturation protease